MPSRIIRIVNKSINKDRLQEEVTGSGIAARISPVGFVTISRRRMDPAPAPKLVAETFDGTTRTQDFADPGEIRIDSEIALTVAEETTLDGVFAAHDFTQLSVGQVAEDQDNTDLTALKPKLEQWDTLSTDEKLAELKKVLRLVLRENLSGVN